MIVSEGVGWTEKTPMVFCTVSAVMQAVPKWPWAANTCRSAEIPAPEDGSKPAIVRSVFTDLWFLYGNKRGECVVFCGAAVVF